LFSGSLEFKDNSELKVDKSALIWERFCLVVRLHMSWRGGAGQMQTTTAMSDALGRYLDLTSQQMQATARNMANVDTPGFKPQGFDFEEVFAQQLNDNSGAAALEGVQAPMQDVDGLVARPDGNNVSMDREGLQLAKAQMQFKLGTQLLKSEFATVMSAIHMDSK
jgi:flagellar basal-body rod protein FlgB